jgi:hypothetical protein
MLVREDGVERSRPIPTKSKTQGGDLVRWIYLCGLTAETQ